MAAMFFQPGSSSHEEVLPVGMHEVDNLTADAVFAGKKFLAQKDTTQQKTNMCKEVCNGCSC